MQIIIIKQHEKDKQERLCFIKFYVEQKSKEIVGYPIIYLKDHKGILNIFVDNEENLCFHIEILENIFDAWKFCNEHQINIVNKLEDL